ncbi:MAG TPA: IS3 family transposase [Acidimicrobiia bacterium]|nr:IS3 family transposase [Acidimicrobiia bacterium]
MHPPVESADLEGGGGFLRGGARPPTEEMIRFVDEHKERRTLDGLRWGVEPICRTLQFAPQTYYAAKSRPPSERSVRDEALKPEILRVWKENYRVYGAPKIWTQLHRENIGVARCTVERLMPTLGIRGTTRGANPATTRTSAGDSRPEDLLDRDFAAEAPNTKWVADFTYVRTRSGFCYVAFVIDCYARMIVGWAASTSMRTDLVLTALEQAIWARLVNPGTRQRLGDGTLRQEPGLGNRLICHSDAGCQYLSIAHTGRLTQTGIDPSVGSVGDSYDNALAESIIGLYKTELVYNLGPWNGLTDLEWATFEYIDWFNHRRLMGKTPPTEREENYYRQHTNTKHPTPKP